MKTDKFFEDKKMNQRLHAEIERLQQKYISIWEDVCNIESQTNDKIGVDKVGKYFIALPSIMAGMLKYWNSRLQVTSFVLQ